MIMVQVTYINADGKKTTVEGADGDSVMRVATANGIDGIIGECGGSMMCATCHCYVDDAWTDRTGSRKDGEDDLLDCAASTVKDNSRLSCQITLRPDLKGLIIHLPKDQV